MFLSGSSYMDKQRTLLGPHRATLLQDIAAACSLARPRAWSDATGWLRADAHEDDALRKESLPRMLARTCLAAVLVLTSATLASAQARDPVAADALFRQARSLMKEGNYAAACPKLAESQRLDPAAGTGINLGDCYQKTGQLADALQSLRDALDMLQPDDPRLAPVKQEIAALTQRVPRLTIKLAPNAPAGTKVVRDDIEYGAASLGVPLPMNPGEHSVVVDAPGRSKKPYRVSLVEGQVAELTVTVGAELAPGPADAPVASAPPPSVSQPTPTKAPVADSPEARPPSNTLGWVLGSVGVVGLGTGIVTGLMLNDRQSTVDANCDSKTKLCNETGYSAAESGRTLRTVSYIGWGVGLAGIAAGSYFLFLAGPNTAPTTTVGAAASGDGAFVSMTRRF